MSSLSLAASPASEMPPGTVPRAPSQHLHSHTWPRLCSLRGGVTRRASPHPLLFHAGAGGEWAGRSRRRLSLRRRPLLPHSVFQSSSRLVTLSELSRFLVFQYSLPFHLFYSPPLISSCLSNQQTMSCNTSFATFTDSELEKLEQEIEEEATRIAKIREDMHRRTGVSSEQTMSSTSSSIAESELEKMELEIMEDEKKMLKVREEMRRQLAELNVDKEEIDARSVYVGNVDYGVTKKGLESHFEACGHINRVSIQVNKYTKQPKGFAYIEFRDKEGMEAALELTDSLLAGRRIKVVVKRTNKPGIGAAAARGARGGARGGAGPHRTTTVVIKYVYTNGHSGKAARGRRAGYRSCPY